MNHRTIVAVSPVSPWPVDNGYSLRVTGLLREIAASWRTILVAPQSSLAGDQARELELLDYVPVDVAGSAATMPWQLNLIPLRDAVERIVASSRPDAALLWSGTEVLGFGRAFPPAVADRIDSATLAAMRMGRGLTAIRQRLRKGLRAAAYERQVVRRMAATVVVGEDDARVMRRVSGRSNVYVVPNGVDLGPIPRSEWEADQPTVIFTGVLSFRPNADAAIDFARSVWPLVHARAQGATLLIAGRDPRANVRALNGLPGVRVRPDVADLRALQRTAWVAVAPMRSGGGIKNKVLEAWACGKPVVMSPLAANGLHPDHTQASVVADSPEDVANAVVHLIEDRAQRQSAGRAGYDLVAEHHSWSEAGRRVSELLALAAGGHSAGGAQSHATDATAGTAAR